MSESGQSGEECGHSIGRRRAISHSIEKERRVSIHKHSQVPRGTKHGMKDYFSSAAREALNAPSTRY